MFMRAEWNGFRGETGDGFLDEFIHAATLGGSKLSEEGFLLGGEVDFHHAFLVGSVIEVKSLAP